MMRFALFGNPVAQTLSPLMHNAALQAMGMDGRYEAILVEDLGEAVKSLRDGRLDGASVTIPFKERVMDLLDGLDEEAEEIGAVNTIVRRDGRLVGFNTDGRALFLSLADVLDMAGRTFAILGTGGTARAALCAVRRGGGGLDLLPFPLPAADCPGDVLSFCRLSPGRGPRRYRGELHRLECRADEEGGRQRLLGRHLQPPPGRTPLHLSPQRRRTAARSDHPDTRRR